MFWGGGTNNSLWATIYIISYKNLLCDNISLVPYLVCIKFHLVELLIVKNLIMMCYTTICSSSSIRTDRMEVWRVQQSVVNIRGVFDKSMQSQEIVAVVCT